MVPAAKVGTSGYAYREWKGKFYPESLKPAGMLSYYANHFSTVEINSSFYRMPTPEVLENWKSQVPAGFRFSFKAPQTITHRKPSADFQDKVSSFLEVTSLLGEQRGALLFQFPPYLAKTLDRLNAILEFSGRDMQFAFEFRNASWFSEDVYEALNNVDAALCIADADDFSVPFVSTASWGYLRLRRTEYSAPSLARWRSKVREERWSEAYVYFKHEDEAKGPRLAQEFIG